MKKKLIPLISIIICAIACALGFAACGDDDGSGNGGGTSVSGLVLIDENGTEHTEYDLGDIVYGNVPDFGALKLYVKYSDNTKRELTENDDVTIEYSYNQVALPQAPTSYDVGIYGIRYTYENYSTAVMYKIVTSAVASPYSIRMNETTWKYGEEPTITVVDRNDSTVDKTKYTLHYIAADQYEEIKNAEDFTYQLISNGYGAYASDSGKYINVCPGEYYFFAYFNGYVNVNSTLQKVTINKGTLKPVYADDYEGFYLANNWWSYGALGKIKISEIGLGVKNNKLSWETESGEPYESSFQIEWKDPDEEIDSTINGKTRMIKCVFGDGLYEDYMFPEPVTIKFDKYSLSVPTVSDSVNANYNTITYDGQNHNIMLYYNGNPYSEYDIEMINKILTIKDGDGNVITLSNDSVLATVSEEGTYTFTFELKDKVNYQWSWTDYNTEGYPTVYSTENREETFVINALWSDIQPFGDYYNLTIDENRQLKFKVEPGTDNAANSTPYKAGTLRVEFLQDYTNGNSNYTSTIDATVEVKNEGGFDYIIITVTDFKDVAHYLSGSIILHVTATGTDHYEDIDKYFGEIGIYKYRFADYRSVTCPLADILTDNTMEQPAGITVAELYETYPELITSLGKWVLEYDYANTGSWTPLGDDAVLPQTSLKCRLVFKSNFVQYVDTIEPYEFTLIGVPNNG